MDKHIIFATLTFLALVILASQVLGFGELITPPLVDTDTNFSTECNDGEYGDGDGNCYSFNESVSNVVASRIYNASAISAENHDGVSGTYSGVNDFGGDNYTLQEANNQDWAVFVNYTNVEDFNNIILRVWYDAHGSIVNQANKQHHIHSCLWDWDGSVWDCEYVELYYAEHFIVEPSLVMDASEHIGTGADEGKVMLKLQHDSGEDNGDNDHEFILDYAILVDGFVGFSATTPAPQSLQEVLNVGNQFATAINGSGNITTTATITAQDGIYQTLETVSLTVTGSAIIEGLLTSENIVPALDSLYSLGNSTNWFKEIFVRDIYSDNINATNITSSSIKSDNLNSTNIDTEEIAIGSATMNHSGDDLVITLT